MKFFLLFWVSVLAYLPAFPQTILSSVCSYSHTSFDKQIPYQQQTLLEGATRDYSHFLVEAITISANQPAQPIQQFDEEVVLLIKAGELTLTLGNKHKTLGPGDLVMIMPGDDYRVDNKAEQFLTYYQVRYTSNEMPDLDLYRLVGSSFWVDWQHMNSIAEPSGSRRGLIPYPTVMSSRIAMQRNRVDPGSGQDSLHTHRAAELVLILEHPVQARIGETLKEARVGDLIFVESAVAHGIYPFSGQGGSYVSFQF